MSLANKLLSASGGEQLYSDSVFSAYTYTGNGATQTVTNGIDLAGSGGMVWIKNRTDATTNVLTSSVGTLNYLQSNAINSYTSAILSSMNSDGFTMNYDSKVNNNLSNIVSWTFRKATKFFDVVTYTGNGANRTIAHSLGITPGMIMVKRTDTTGSWMVYHNSIANTENLVLNTTAEKATNATAWNSTTATASVFSLGTHADVNTNGGAYVAYLFAHDTSADGIIQCGSFTSSGTGAASVNLGFEPQFIIIRRPAIADNWKITDTMRGWTNTNGTNLKADSAAQEVEFWNGYLYPTATGFEMKATAFGNNEVWIYLAIRRPNKPPTVGTQVYNAIARTGTGAAATITGVGFAPDLLVSHQRNAPLHSFRDKLRGALRVSFSSSTAPEYDASSSPVSFSTDGMIVGSDSFNWEINGNTASYINHFFKRAPGVFDIVAYTGTGVARTVSHNLGAVPEMMIVKCMSNAVDWVVYDKYTGATKRMILNLTDATVVSVSNWNDTDPTNNLFTIGTGAGVNANNWTYVAYLFATKAGISKVGNYTGNGSNQTINCGFTTGARFILIKCISATGDWFVWDTVRGIVAGNDPHLSLNTTVAEVSTDDSIDPDSTGFIVNQVAATNINVTSATYIFLALA